MSKSEQPNPKQAAIPTIPIAIVVLVLIGIGLAAELTSIHYNTHSNPEFHSLCAISETVNCETVALSVYSVFLRLPVSVWGLIGYFVILLFAGLSIYFAKRRGALAGAVFGFSTIAFLSSAALAYISFTKIDSLCLFCMGTYIVNTLLLALGILLVVQSKKGLFGAIQTDIVFLFKKPALLLTIATLGIGAIIVPYILITPYWETPGFEETSPVATGIDKENYHWAGAKEPKVIIIEYTDYECPYCKNAHKQIRELVSKYADKVRIVHRHFPLDNSCNPKVTRKFHKYACLFSTAVECAARHNQFWEMNDAIFSSENAQSIDVEKFALQLGIDRGDFAQCLADESIQKEILRNIEAGIKDGVSATPTFIANGQKFTGRLSESQLIKLLDAAK